LVDELIDVLQELSRVNIIKKVDINFMLSQKAETLLVVLEFYKCYQVLEHDKSGTDAFQVASWHLEHHSQVIGHNDPCPSLHCSHIKILIVFNRLQNWGICAVRWLRQGTVQVIDVQVMEEVWGGIDEQKEVLVEGEASALVAEESPVDVEAEVGAKSKNGFFAVDIASLHRLASNRKLKHTLLLLCVYILLSLFYPNPVDFLIYRHDKKVVNFLLFLFSSEH
jgi:hypothetical protein